MGKRKRGSNKYSSKGFNSSRFGNNRREIENARRNYEKRLNAHTQKLTRDIFVIAKPVEGLSLAEDLRIRHPFEVDTQGRKFRNIDGSLAMTEYKREPVKKKTILFIFAMFIVFVIILRLAFVDVDINVSKYFSLIKFW